MEMPINNPIITIAIPFFNAQHFLAQAIESVINQTHQNWLLILIDDGSVDNSLKIAKEYQQKDSRIKVYSDGQNRNLGFRLNQITLLVETKYLARMDADDIMHPQRIEKQLAVLEHNEDIDILGTNVYTINQFDEVTGLRYNFDKVDKLIKVNGFIHPTIIGKTNWFKQNPYDVKAVRIEDAELWFRSSKHSNFQMLSEPLLFYREFGNHYYKKYFKAYISLFYISRKNKFNMKWLSFAIKFVLSGSLYFLFDLFGKESFLIIRRNQKQIKNKTINQMFSDRVV